MKKIHWVLGAILVLLFGTGCATRNVHIDKEVEKSLTKPTKVAVYDITSMDLVEGRENPRDQLKKFPFISNQPVIDYRGKFPDSFYQMNPYRFRAMNIKNVDFWKLREEPFSLDFIYVTPTWIKSFKRVSDDLFEDLGYTYNLSKKEQEILKWWIAQGGVLWCEAGLYTTLYDTYKKDGTISSKRAYALLKRKAFGLHFLDKPLVTFMSRAKRLDYVVYVPRKKVFTTHSDKPFLKEIHRLCLESKNFIDLYYLIKGDILLQDNKGKPLVTKMQMGKGLIVSLLPFEYQDTQCDGELLRWKLLYYALDKQYRLLPQSVVYKTHNYQHLDLNESVVRVDENRSSIPSEKKTEKEAKKATATVNPEPQRHANDESYCIQLYSSKGINDVLAKFQREDARKLPESRVEKIGDLYVIRAGKYDSVSKANKERQKIKDRLFGDAFVRKCKYDPKRFVKHN